MLVEANIWAVAQTERGSAVLLRPQSTEKVVPIIVHQSEAQSIIVGLRKVTFMRPQTHDLLVLMANQFATKILRAEITDIRDEIFYTRLVFRSKGLKRVILDTRLSDALGVAARSGCPLFLAESIIEKCGVHVDEVMNNSSGPPTEGGDTDRLNVDQLKDDLKKAVDKENYEEAARIRDKIHKLNSD